MSTINKWYDDSRFLKDVTVYGNLSIEKNLTLTGDLLVWGNTVALDVVQATVEDPVFTVNYNYPGNAAVHPYANLSIKNIGSNNTTVLNQNVQGNVAGFEIYGGPGVPGNAYMLAARDSFLFKLPDYAADQWINLNQSLATGDNVRFQSVNVTRAGTVQANIAGSGIVLAEPTSGNLYAVGVLPAHNGGTGGNLAFYGGNNYVLTVAPNGNIVPITTSAIDGQFLIANAQGQFNLGNIVAGSGINVVQAASGYTISTVAAPNTGALYANVIVMPDSKLHFNSVDTVVDLNGNVVPINPAQPLYAWNMQGNAALDITVFGNNWVGVSTGALNTWAVLIQGISVGALISADMTTKTANVEVAKWRVTSNTANAVAPFIYTYGPSYTPDANVVFVRTPDGNTYARVSLPAMGVDIDAQMKLSITQTP